MMADISDSSCRSTLGNESDVLKIFVNWIMHSAIFAPSGGSKNGWLYLKRFQRYDNRNVDTANTLFGSIWSYFVLSGFHFKLFDSFRAKSSQTALHTSVCGLSASQMESDGIKLDWLPLVWLPIFSQIMTARWVIWRSFVYGLDITYI